MADPPRASDDPSPDSPHDHAWQKVEGPERDGFQQYRCALCGALWPAD